MSNDYSMLIEISGEGEKVVKKVFHQLVKECDNAGRYGHNVSARQVDESEIEELEGGFE